MKSSNCGWVSVSFCKRRSMNPQDRILGMGRKISRRDFINGVSAATAGASLMSMNWALAQEAEFAPEKAADYYPPSKTGMRGSHPG